MGISMKMVTFDCADPRSLAEWWAAAVDGKIEADYGEFVMVAASPLFLGFQRVPEEKQVKNRMHPDFLADDREAEVARLTGLGATIVGAARRQAWCGRRSRTPRVTNSTSPDPKDSVIKEFSPMLVASAEELLDHASLRRNSLITRGFGTTP